MAALIDKSTTYKITIDPITEDNFITKAEADGTIIITGTLWKDLTSGYALVLKVGGYEYPANITKTNNPNKDDWSLKLTDDKLAALLSSDEVIVSVYDADGALITFKSHKYSVDTTPPEAGTLDFRYLDDTGRTTDAVVVTQDRTLDLTLTGQEAGATVVYQQKVDGAWTNLASPNLTNLTDGSYEFRAVVTDAVGNTSYSNVKSVVVDTTASAAGTLSFSGLYGSEAGTKDNTFDLSLTVHEANSTVVYQQKIGNGEWTNLTSPNLTDLVDGTYHFRAVITDAAGNFSYSDVKSVAIDITKPATLGVALTEDTGPTDGITSNSDLTLTGEEYGAKVEYSLDGETWTTTAPAVANLVQGSNTVQVRQTDTAGNVSEVNSITFTLDSTKPVAPGVALATDSGVNGDHLTSDGTLKVTAEEDATVEYSIDGGKTWADSFTAAEGENSVEVRQTDKAGNVSYASEVFTFTLDTAKPVTGTMSFLGLSGAEEGTKDTAFDLFLVGQEDGASVTYEVKDAEGNWNATTAQQNDLEDGSYEFRAVVTDAAGKTSYSNVKSVVVDTTAPAAGMLSLSGLSDTGPNATGGLTSDNTFDLTLTNNDANSTVAFEVSKDGGASWQVTSSAQNGLTDGNYLFRAVVTNAAGSSSYSNAKSITVDASVPSVAVAIAAVGANGTSTVTLRFGEAITGLTTDDLQVTGGSVANLTADPSGKIFTGTFTPAANFEGTASITVNAGSYTDVAGNPGVAGSASLAVDMKAPTIDMLVKSFLGAHAVTFNFNDQLSAASFTADDLVVGGAIVKALVSDSSMSQTAIMHTALGSGGKISVAVEDGSYTDDSGNVGAGLSKTFDVTTSKATAGADWLVGAGGRNVLKGGAGDDIVRGRGGNDVITGGSGKDLLDLSDGKKGIKIDFSAANVKYAAFEGRAAGLGVDKYRDMEGVIGTNYSDKITGSSSGDILAGLGGNDILRGGRGNDVFVFEAKGGRDRIMDFGDKARNQDGLDLRYFDFNVTADSFAAWKASHVKQIGANVLVNIDATTSVKLIDVKAKAIGFDDFLF
ncbi:Ig-like domain-containing protein [Microvirga aerophila]|uniref:Bacterial Ig-like domain-containing protein n=1 Tax=Microvirga aerophila TaxID=670291 RepID=A0A512C233_9HYPH|nr:Ig-like domain-containing protein [Microvirga aerophila]GEO18239.1 hypothetical protein MAE02_59350 [Microvirga aerophila]